jgi:hypothetical protein
MQLIYIFNLITSLTHSLEFFFKLRLMLTVCDAKIIVRIRALINTVWRGWCSYGHDGGRTLRPLRLPNFINGHHIFFLLGEKTKKSNQRGWELSTVKALRELDRDVREIRRECDLYIYEKEWEVSWDQNTKKRG